jgi:hypothetical protein
MIFKQTEKTHLAVFIRVYIDLATDPGWGAWHIAHPVQRYYYGPMERYADIDAAMDVAQRRLIKQQAAYSNNPYRREFKIAKVTTLTTYEDV